MTYYPDLSPYSYVDLHNSESGEPMVNVGWLGREVPFTQGSVDQRLVPRLIRIAKPYKNMFRGYHSCEFCDEESPRRVAIDFGKGEMWIGSGEIHVRGKSGCLYAAPTLIIHYIKNHQYRPPAEFIEAVLVRESRDIDV